MKYYSTNHNSPPVSLREAVLKGLAPDRGLYMPERIGKLPAGFFQAIGSMTFHEIACEVANVLFGEDIPREDLDRIVTQTLSFETPVVAVERDIYALELFHGPTAAFKDVGARFMARMLSYILGKEGKIERVTVLAATSGDTGSAVANGFLGVDGIDVVVLYPSGKVSPLQEKQFTTLGRNITAIEVDGTFDDCQNMVKSTFLDENICRKHTLTSANSINVARLLPQSFYYFNAYAQLKKMGKGGETVFCVPSGNYGNLTAGIVAARMGLPVKRFIAANNRNDIFLEYLRTGCYTPRRSVETVANAMDVGDPSNFARIMDLYGNDVERVRADISAYGYTDEQICAAVEKTYHATGYILDPHGACGYMALTDGLRQEETGVYLETAHPAKFSETVRDCMGIDPPLPDQLKKFAGGEKKSIEMTADNSNFKIWLDEHCSR